MNSTPVEDKWGHLQGWLEELIDTFRQEAQQQLTEAQIASVGKSGNYLAPCQIEIIWIANPEFQIVVVSNFLDRKDKEIIINGPFQGHEVIDAIDNLLKEPRWTKPLPVTGGQAPLLPYPVEFTNQLTLAEVFSGVLYGDIETIKESFLQRVKRPSEFGGFPLGNEAFVWLIAGNISDMPKNKFIDDFIRQAKFEPPTQQPTPSPTLPQIRCTAAYVYPPIRIGAPPKPMNFGEFSSGMYMYRFGQVAFETKFDNYRMIITKDGLIAITGDNRELALRIFNVVFGTAELCGIPAQAVRESEIGAITFDEATMATMTYSMPMRTLRSMPILERRGQRFSFMSTLRRVVTEDKISEVVGKAQRIYQHLDKSEELSFFLQALTHLEDTEFAQSFTMSWIIVEKYLSRIWKNFMQEKKVYGERENKLTNPGMWSTDFVIETLNLSGVLSEQRYKLLMELKKERNNFIHKGRAITKDDAEECLKMAKEIVLCDLEGLI